MSWPTIGLLKPLIQRSAWLRSAASRTRRRRGVRGGLRDGLLRGRSNILSRVLHIGGRLLPDVPKLAARALHRICRLLRKILQVISGLRDTVRHLPGVLVKLLILGKIGAQLLKTLGQQLA